MFVIREADGVNFYDGYVVKGERSGFGRCVFKDAATDAGGFFEGEYIGEWANDKRHGIGTQILKVGWVRHRYYVVAAGRTNVHSEN